MANPKDVANSRKHKQQAGKRARLKAEAENKEFREGFDKRQETRRRISAVSKRPAEHPPVKESPREVGEALGNYREVVVRVSASNRAKEHTERRLVKRVQKQNEQLADTKKRLDTKMNSTIRSLGASVPGAGKKPVEKKPGPIERPAEPKIAGTTPDDRFGRFGNLSGASAETVRRRVGQVANEIFRNETDPNDSQSSRERQAVTQAIDKFNIEYAKRGPRKVQTTLLTPSKVREAAFKPHIEQLSPKEANQRFPSKPKAKTNVGQRIKDKTLAGSVPLAPKQTRLNTEKIQQQTEAKDTRRHRLEPGDTVEKSSTSSAEFLRQIEGTDEGDWVQEQMTSKNGVFFGMKNNQVPGAYRRWQRYMNARSVKDPVSGEARYQDLGNIKDWLTTDTRGRKSREKTMVEKKHNVDTGKIVKDRYTKGIVSTQGVKASDRYKPRIPSHEDFGIGIQVPGIPTDREFKEMFPDASDLEVLQIKQATLQDLQEDILKNQRAAHEERQELLLKRPPSDRGASNEDRVMFFTTSTGWPAISVGANSLIGQYIIKKRKKMLVDTRLATRAEVKGEFPTAVRDQHLIEAATGLTVGAQGRYGAFRHVGYRAGAKKSKGYGKVVPVGAQVLRDSSGQPLYDRNGNLRYTEGFTRPFEVKPSNEVGLRVYLG